MLIGRYEIGARVGRGGMADVYRAVDTVSGAAVAVKIFRPGVDAGHAGPRMRREVELLSSLDHPGLVRIVHADLDDPAGGDGPPFIVMELVDGETLRDRLRRAPLSELQVVSLGAQLCATLAYVHGRGIVHRDVKPANILLAGTDDHAEPTARLTDFGIARLIDSTRMTAEGFTVGTPNYLSPEQVTGSALGTASDVYSLALILIEALNRRVVFPGHGLESAIARLSRQPAIEARVSVELGALLRDMTAHDAASRPTAAEAARRFGALRGERPSGIVLESDGHPGAGSVTAPLPVAMGWSRQGRARRQTRFGLLGLGAAAAAAIAATTIVLQSYVSPTSPSDPPVQGAVNTPAAPSRTTAPTTRPIAKPSPAARQLAASSIRTLTPKRASFHVPSPMRRAGAADHPKPHANRHGRGHGRKR